MNKFMCTCAVHCPESTYHERACCGQVWCECLCHLGKRSDEEERSRIHYFRLIHEVQDLEQKIKQLDRW